MSLKRTLRKVKYLFERKYYERWINFENKGEFVFVDVGSIGWLPQPWRNRENIKYIKHLIRFDPNESGCSKARNITTYNKALWSSDCTLPLYEQCGSTSGSSLFEQNFEYVKDNFDTLKQVGPQKLATTWFMRSALKQIHYIHCVSLDSVLTLAELFFMKIDAQGAELEIIKGAKKFLNLCIGIQVECLTVPLLKNAPLLPEVREYLERHNFILQQQFLPHGTFDSQCDCLFINRGFEGQFKKPLLTAYRSIGVQA